MVYSRNPGESVVALLAALGIRTVEVPATETWVTAGSTGSKPAKVSYSLTDVDSCLFELASGLSWCV